MKIYRIEFSDEENKKLSQEAEKKGFRTMSSFIRFLAINRREEAQ